MKQIVLFLLSIFVLSTTTSCATRYDDAPLWEEINAIKDRLEKMNTEIDALKIIASAIENGVSIINVVETGYGYEFIFSDGKKISLRHGENGNDGQDAPAVGIKLFEGVYYWTINGTWLTDNDGDKIPVTGSDGRTPEISIDQENYWTINGERIRDERGDFVKAVGQNGDSFFQDITETETDVIFTLMDGSVIQIQKTVTVIFTLDKESLTLGYGQTARVGIIQSGVKYTSISKPDGWKANLFDDILTVKAPTRPNDFAERLGTISIVAVGQTSTVVASLTVYINPDISGGGAGESEWENW